MSFVLRTTPGALVAIPFQGAIVYGEAPDASLGPEDLRFLTEIFPEQIEILLPYIQTHPSHVYVPLSTPEEGYHASFSGRFTLEDMRPFFRHTPNALTVVDGRPWGFFRIRLKAVAPDLTCERVAEIEVHTAQESAASGFELFWAEPDTHRPTRIRVYDPRPEEGSQAVGGLVTKWADRIRKTQILTAAERAELVAVACNMPGNAPQAVGTHRRASAGPEGSDKLGGTDAIRAGIAGESDQARAGRARETVALGKPVVVQ